MTYDEPFRLRLLKGLTEVLQGITPENGYTVDLSEAVFRGRSSFGEGDPVPMVSILDAIKTVDGSFPADDSGEAKTVYPLLVQGWAHDDIAGNPTDPCHYLMADVKKALSLHRAKHGKPTVAGGPDYNWFGMAGGVVGFKYNGGVVRPADEISDRAYFWLLLDIELVEDMANPYA